LSIGQVTTSKIVKRDLEYCLFEKGGEKDNSLLQKSISMEKKTETINALDLICNLLSQKKKQKKTKKNKEPVLPIRREHVQDIAVVVVPKPLKT
jgi:hypothetical protein